MAAIIFNSAHQAEHIGERLETMLTVLRDSLDAFVSHRMRLAAAQAGHIWPRQVRPTSPPSTNAQ